MLKEQDKFIHRVVVSIDVCIIAACLQTAYVLRDYLDLKFLHPLLPLGDCLLVLYLLMPLWYLVATYFGLYRPMREKGGWQLFGQTFGTSLAALLVFSVIAFCTKCSFVSQGFFLIFLGTAVALLTIEKLLFLWFLRNGTQKGLASATASSGGNVLRMQDQEHLTGHGDSQHRLSLLRHLRHGVAGPRGKLSL